MIFDEKAIEAAARKQHTLTDDAICTIETGLSRIDFDAQDEAYKASDIEDMRAVLSAALTSMRERGVDIEAIVKFVPEIETALLDWGNTYAPEFSGKHLAISQERICNAGGTLAYVAELKAKLRAAYQPKESV